MLKRHLLIFTIASCMSLCLTACGSQGGTNSAPPNITSNSSSSKPANEDTSNPSNEKGNRDNTPHCLVPLADGTNIIGNETVDELGYPIDDADKRENDSKTGVRDAICFTQCRHGKGKVLAHKIEHGIAYHGANYDSPLPMLEGVLCLHICHYLAISQAPPLPNTRETSKS